MAAMAALQTSRETSRAARVLALVDAMLAKKGRPGAGPDQPLRDAGLSSLDTVNLILAVEGEFDLFIPQGEMTPENFHSVDRIAALLDRLA